MAKKDSRLRSQVPEVAGNGLLDRRALLGRGIAFAGAAATGAGASLTGAAAEPLKDDPWSLAMGSVLPPRQQPSRFEDKVVRTLSNPNNEFRNSHACTPHHLLHGTVTPSSAFHHLPFGRAGYRPGQAPTGDPRPGEGTKSLFVEDLARYPMCRAWGLSSAAAAPASPLSEPMQVTAQRCTARLQLGGTGVMLSTSRRDRHRPEGEMASAEGADLARAHRSTPVEKALDDAMIAFYQNGERIMPGNGYPMRLLPPATRAT